MNVTILSSPQRLRDAERTRDAILRAGQRLFAFKGYSTTGVREVAAAAGVSSALVRRYFGSKEGLLRATLDDVLDVRPLIAGDRAEFGKRSVAFLFQADTIPNPVAIMMLSLADTAARDLCRDLIQQNVLIPLANWLGGMNAMDRAVRLNLLWTGFMSARQLLKLEPLNDEHVTPTRRWIEGITQSIVDES